MNTQETKAPDFSCRVVRFVSLFASDERAARPASFQSRHLASCAACREYFATANEIERRLTHDASAQSQSTPENLEQRIMRAVREAAPPRSHSQTRRVVFSLAGAAAALALGIFLLRPSPPRHDALDDSRTVAQLAAVVQTLPGLIRNSVAPTAAKITQNNTLLHEVDSVYSDAQSALNFLAMNFLPTNAKQGTAPTAGERPAQNG